MTSKERAYLRSCAQRIDPVVYVGRDGLSDGVARALSEALEAHELVKVRFQGFKDEIKDISAALGERTGSALVAITGFTAVFYKHKDDPAERVYGV